MGSSSLGRETIPGVTDLVHPRAATRPPRTPQARSAVTMPSGGHRTEQAAREARPPWRRSERAACGHWRNARADRRSGCSFAPDQIDGHEDKELDGRRRRRTGRATAGVPSQTRRDEQGAQGQNPRPAQDVDLDRYVQGCRRRGRQAHEAPVHRGRRTCGRLAGFSTYSRGCPAPARR